MVDRNKMINVLVSDKELEIIDEATEKQDRTRASFIRQASLKIAQEVLQKSGDTNGINAGENTTNSL